jgi:hypothetical protein
MNSVVSAIRINEVELNPAGEDKGNEWIELFNDEEVNLTGLWLLNSDGEKFLLDNFSSFEGYLVVVFPKQWLDNSNESISLYNSNSLVDKTEVLVDSKNNNLAWSYCDGEWKFLEESKGSENNCGISEEQSNAQSNLPNSQTEETDKVNEDKSNNIKNSDEKVINVKANVSEMVIPPNKTPITSEVIRLNSPIGSATKDIKSNQILYKSKTEIIKEYAIYLYAILCTFALIFVIIKRR